MSQKIKDLTGGHLCEHGVQRATAQNAGGYAGPVKTCSCCRSPYGALQQQLQTGPHLCFGCGGKKDTPKQRREFDQMLDRNYGRKS